MGLLYLPGLELSDELRGCVETQIMLAVKDLQVRDFTGVRDLDTFKLDKGSAEFDYWWSSMPEADPKFVISRQEVIDHMVPCTLSLHACQDLPYHVQCLC